MAERAIRDIGEVLNHSVTKTELTGSLDQGRFRITAPAFNVFRIQISHYDEFQSNPFSVLLGELLDLEVNESDQEILVAIDQLNLTIRKNPFRCTFSDTAGNILSEDDPGLGTAIQGTQLTQYKTLQAGERFLGMGEKTGHLNRRGSGFINWNTDRYAFGTDQDPLYASIPFYIGTHDGRCYGIYLDNTYRSDFNFGASNNRFSSFSVDDGDLDYYFIAGTNVQEVISSYTRLTGTIPLPPVWSIGYQQCRYSYYPQNEVTRLSEKFRDKKIPADVIVLDIHYMEKFKIFTWDGEKFPDPAAMIKALKEKGFEVVVICDPGIKAESGYAPFDSGMSEDVFIKYPDGSEYTAEVWPGWCHFPDFTSEKARAWWQNQLTSYTDLGIKGYWNDMNEIASWGNMMPDNILFDHNGQNSTTKRARNIYGMQMARATFEASRVATGERTFNLTRAGFAGLQRYSALWTGDNVSSDEHMMLAVRMILSLGMSGVPFAGSDIGGFVGNANGRLFARWVQIAAFAPFFRAHTMINSNSAEPWSFGEEVEEISTNFIRLRYKLLPHLYQAFRQASLDGTPVMRSLAIDYTTDHLVYDHEFENQFFFGQSILVAPLESFKDVKKVYLPAGIWYDFFTGRVIKGDKAFFHECGSQTLPVFVRESSVVCMYPEIGNHTREIGKTLDVHIYHGPEQCTTTYYEDDGSSFDFESGGYFLREIIYDPSGKIIMKQVQGTYPSAISKIRVWMHGLGLSEVKVSGQNREIQTGDYELIKPISNFDPMVTPDDSSHPRNKRLAWFELENTREEVLIDLKF